MKKKNEREQELDQKEFEKDLHQDLTGQYRRIDVDEKLHKGKNKFAIAAMNFFSTVLCFEVFYWLIKTNVNFITLGYTVDFFKILAPIIHAAILIVSIYAVKKRRSAVDIILERWPI